MKVSEEKVVYKIAIGSVILLLIGYIAIIADMIASC